MKETKRIDGLESPTTHETVEQWELRTGEVYPADAPVYTWVNNKEWVLSEKENSLHFYDYTRAETSKCIVATHLGKPKL